MQKFHLYLLVKQRKLYLSVNKNFICQFMKSFYSDYVRTEKANASTGRLGLKFKAEEEYMSILKNVTGKYFKASDTKLYPKLWTDLKRESFEKIEGLNIHNFNGIMMTFLRKEKLYNQAVSFYQHVQRNEKINDATLVNFMIAAAESGDDRTAIETYLKLNKTLFVIPAMQELVVRGLVKTNLWKESLQIFKQASVVHASACLEAASVAFKYNDFEICIQLLKEIIKSTSTMNHSVYKNLLKFILNLHGPEQDIILNIFLDSLQKNRHVLSAKNASLLREVIRRQQTPSNISSVIMKSDYDSTLTPSFNSTGECPECHYKLECPRLTPEEHAQLTETLLNHLIQGSTSGERSNPNELQTFLRFLEKAKPYNIVVDALNIAHTFKYGPENPELANKLLKVVTTLTEEGYQPLVLGKKRIWYWDQHIITKVEHKAKCFYTDNISADDPFMLYAALYSGPDTPIMTFDMLRDHALRLPTESKDLFQTWKRSVQVIPKDLDGQIQVWHFHKYPVCAQGSWDTGWHIPYDEESETHKSVVPFRKRRLNWLCVQRKRR